MITNVILNNFKGRTETVELDQCNIFFGPNGSGKSAITEGVTLALTGYVRGVKRQNQEIYRKMFSGIDDPFASTEHSVGFVFQSEGIRNEFKRAFSPGKGESIAQEYFVNGKKVSKDKYSGEMIKCHIPGIFDIESFIELSDDKKINAIFERFGDLDDSIEIESKIDAAKTEINRLNSLIKVNTGVSQKLSISRAEYELPSGSLAEVNNDIEKIEAELKLANKHLTKLKIEEAERVKEAETIKKMEDTKQAAQEIFGGEESDANVSPTTAIRGYVDKDSPLIEGLDAIDEFYLNDTDIEQQNRQDFVNRQVSGNKIEASPRDSIQKIINAIESVACPLCSNGAGILTAKAELKKYEVSDETY